MTGRQVQKAIEAYLESRGWRQSKPGYWRDPRNRNSVWPWSAALDVEADREAVEHAVNGNGVVSPAQNRNGQFPKKAL